MRLLLDRGPDPNVDDERGNTALIGCAWDADAALALIKHGANVNVQNKEGHQSADDVSLRDKQGKTALDEAKV